MFFHVFGLGSNSCLLFLFSVLFYSVIPIRSLDQIEFVFHSNFLLISASVCPLAFPNTKHVAKSCGNAISNRTVCCTAMESYVSHLQKQSLITNLQALDCATLLGMKLQKSNITTDVYKLCHLSLKDFSLQGQSLDLFHNIP